MTCVAFVLNNKIDMFSTTILLPGIRINIHFKLISNDVCILTENELGYILEGFLQN
jgi:hypothetical protein